MPIRRQTLDSVVVHLHPNASSLLASCASDFKAHERAANIIYPFALKAKPTSSSPLAPLRRNSAKSQHFTYLDESSSDTESESGEQDTYWTTNDDFWLSVWTARGRAPASLDMVLSCTRGPIGNYPIFLYSNVDDDALTPDFVTPRIELLVARLKSCVPPKRVFSVFGQDPLTKSFVEAWSNATLAVPVPEAYYAAKHTFCTRATLTDSPTLPLPQGHQLRLADMGDLIRMSELCYGFASGSAPFLLSPEDAVREAHGYIQARQIYVYDICYEDGRRDAASIVCVTRTSPGVSAITKVYTNPNHRGRKYAEKLVRYVCQQLLLVANKSSVVLFVAHDNEAAEKVYDRVGFQGLCGKPRPEGVNDWVEIGFEDTDLGHW